VFDKVIEDIYNKLRRRKGGILLLVLAAIVIAVFMVWTSLPDSAKERILLGSEGTKLRTTSQSESPERATSVSKIEIPDLAKATAAYYALSESDLAVESGTIRDASPEGVRGYFDVVVPPSSHVYGSARVLLRRTISPHFFLTARVAGDANVGTLELQGLGVFFLLNNQDNSYMIYNSEENQTPWKLLPFPKDAEVNTIGLYQNGRRVMVFLNSKFVASFDLWNSPSPGQVGLFVKTNPQRGGLAHLQRLAAYQF
jgi:hypothetical protein